MEEDKERIKRAVESIRQRAEIINTISKDMRNIESEVLKCYAREEIRKCSNGILTIIKREINI